MSKTLQASCNKAVCHYYLQPQLDHLHWAAGTKNDVPKQLESSLLYEPGLLLLKQFQHTAEILSSITPQKLMSVFGDQQEEV